MKCFYHNDMDGKCSAAIVYKWYIRDLALNEEFKYISINYKDDFPFKEINKEELVVIVDFSLESKDAWQKLLKITKNVIWIDHHKSAIEKAPEEVLKLEGLREIGTAACELTWQCFYPGMKIPKVVALLADFDVWKFALGKNTNYFQTITSLYETDPSNDVWVKWLDSEYIPYVEVKDGELCDKYKMSCYEKIVKNWGFMTEFEGYKTVCCNTPNASSLLFNSIRQDFDIMMLFVFDGKQWIFSIYTKKDNIDCSKIAEKYGGGGHKQAAGFQLKTLPFVVK